MSTPAPAPELQVRVTAVEPLTPQIKSFRLVAADGGLLPGFQAGAHVQVEVPAAADGGAAQWRSYSLIHADADAATEGGVREYRIAVRLEEASRGGSSHMHARVREGDLITLRAPTNHFPLAAAPTTLLLAGGIGVTPIISLATALKAQGRPFELHYSSRSQAQFVLVDELRALAGTNGLHLHADDDPATRLSIEALLQAASPAQPIYVCGPAGMIDATVDTARRLGWHDRDIHFERFTEAAPQAGDQPFEVVLKSSGRVVPVAADRSVLDALADAGVDVMYDCRAGYCGLCQTGVCEGEIDHRDTYLGDTEKAAGKCMQVCVSRARGGRLVLDL